MTVPVHGLPPVMSQGMHAVLVPPRLKGPRIFEVVEVDDGPSGSLVRLEGIDDIGAAKELVGKTILVPEDELPEGFALHDCERMLGREVVDVELGSIGTIQEVLASPAQDVWVCRGQRGEVLVPVVDAFVLAVPETGAIQVKLPAGLVEGY